MKIRTDFVTNSSSSSFVAITVKGNTLDEYLKQHNLLDIFDRVTWPYVEWRFMATELNRSFSTSLCGVLERYLEDYNEFEENEKIDPDAILNLISFLKKNKTTIDAESEGSIEMIASDGEDGFAYAQELSYKDHCGTLKKWPCKDGWDDGYEKIQEFREKLFNGEIPELDDLEYDAIWDIVWDDKALALAVQRTGEIDKFNVSQVAQEGEIESEEELSLMEIEPVNVDWIKGAVFVFTGLSVDEEAIATDVVFDQGGEVKSSVVLKTNYVVYNPHYDHETVKLKKARELIEKGKPIQLLTVSEFCEKLVTSEDGAIVRKSSEKETIVPSTLKECVRLFDCMIQDGVCVIRNVKKPTAELIIPGVVDGFSVVIRQNAFQKQKDLKKVVFCEGVIEIGADAFTDCIQLNEVQFAQTINKVGSNVFGRTPMLSNAGGWLIINGILVRYTGNDAVIAIPDGVSNINDFAFAYNKSITRIILPDSVMSIGDSAFYTCLNLSEVQFPNHDVSMGANPFSDTAMERESDGFFILNDVLLGFNMDYYFIELQNCETLIIPEGVKVIGKNAFGCDGFGGSIYNWDKVKSIVLPDGLETIGENAFRSFRKMETLVLPSTLTCIGAHAFTDCSSLLTIQFPNGLKEIGDGAFSSFNGESNQIQEIVLPDSVERIGDRVFARCRSLKKLKLPKKLETIPPDLAFSCDSLVTVEMPETSRVIGDSAFEDCAKLEQIRIPDGVEHIGSRAFEQCPKLTLEVLAGSYAEKYAIENDIPSLNALDEQVGVLQEGVKKTFGGIEKLEKVSAVSTPGLNNAEPEERISVAEAKVAEIIRALKERYPEGSDLPKSFEEIKFYNSDLQLSTLDKWTKIAYQTKARDYLIQKGLLRS